MRNAFVCQFNNLFEKVYVTSLSKLSIEEILAIYQMIHDVQNSRNAARFKEQSRKLIIHSIVRELLKRQMPLKMIIDQLVVCIAPNKNVYEFQNILTSVESYVKRAEYWNTVRSLILMFEPSKDIIENVLRVCVETKNLADIEDVNNTLMNELDSILRLTLDRNLVKSFYNLITEKTARDSCPVATISRFGKCERVESIASPDSKQNAGALQAESSRTQDVASNSEVDMNRDERESSRGEDSINQVSYTLQPIDDLPDARSIYRDCANLWKFFADLDRFKKGLTHKDYDYVIDILKSYMEKSGENSLFVRSCCTILRAEIKHSKYHLEQIIQRTGKLYFNTHSKI
ncbi:hypothetical protein X777_16658 [Ooceraea biroi]|uniref:Uncharacterized protein n=1 Tax=Ooceraea biroi TaxID=2015173 RepID=A0A026WUF6_OOCBI|nr:hypothetical protein X777_16658 [Ooceraea biroi]